MLSIFLIFFSFEHSLSLSEAAWERLQVVFAQQCANPVLCLLSTSSGGGSRQRHHKHQQGFFAALRRAKQTSNCCRKHSFENEKQERAVALDNPCPSPCTLVVIKTLENLGAQEKIK